MIHLCPNFPEYLPQGVPWLDMCGPNPPPQRNIPAPLGFEPLVGVYMQAMITSSDVQVTSSDVRVTYE